MNRKDRERAKTRTKDWNTYFKLKGISADDIQYNPSILDLKLFVTYIEYLQVLVGVLVCIILVLIPFSLLGVAR